MTGFLVGEDGTVYQVIPNELPDPQDYGWLEPNFAKCGRCGADAAEFCSWNPADGWCCRKCGGCDSDE